MMDLDRVMAFFEDLPCEIKRSMGKERVFFFTDQRVAVGSSYDRAVACIEID